MGTHPLRSAPVLVRDLGDRRILPKPKLKPKIPVEKKHIKYRWSLRMYKYFHPTLYNGYHCLSMPGLKMIHIGKGVPIRYGPLLFVWCLHKFCYSEKSIIFASNCLLYPAIAVKFPESMIITQKQCQYPHVFWFDSIYIYFHHSDHTIAS